MKTIKDIDLMLDAHLKDYRLAKEDHDERRMSKISKLMEPLKRYRMYLQTNPSVAFLESERERLIRKIDAISDGYSAWFDTSPEASGLNNPEKHYHTIMGTKKVKDQLASINFLLS